MKAIAKKSTFRSNEFYLNALRSKAPQDIEILYRDHFFVIKNLILKNGGTETDARDFFQEGLIVMYSKVQVESFSLNCQFRTYLLRVCRNLWLKSKRNKGIPVELEGCHFIDYESSVETDQKGLFIERRELFKQKLNLLKEDEKKVMELFITGFSMKEIATKMGYKNANYAKKKKSVVQTRLIDLIRNDRIYRELAS